MLVAIMFVGVGNCSNGDGQYAITLFYTGSFVIPVAYHLHFGISPLRGAALTALH